MRMSRKITIVTASVLFFVLAGTGVASALWSTPATVTSTVQVASLADNCTNVTSMVNASFETPVITSSIGYATGDGGTTGMDGWRTRTLSGGATRIEIWKSGATYDGLPAVVAPVGSQFVELNADEAGIIYQDLATTAGQTLQWSFMHRGRTGSDTMELLIGAPDTYIVQNTFTDDNVNRNGNNGWVRYSGAYVVPAGQTTTRLAFRSVTAGSLGNFLDDVSLGSGPCINASSTATSTTPLIGETVTYTTTVTNSGSSPASAASLNWTLPAGLTYKANSLTIGGVAGGTATGASIVAPLGTGSTATVGGSVAQGISIVVSFQAVVSAPVDTVLGYTPEVDYTNGLATGWARTATAPNAPITVVRDTTAPTAPGKPVASATGAAQTTLTWTGSTDNVGVVAYDVYRATVVGGVTGTPVRVNTGDSTALTFTNTGLATWSTYSYTIKARDAAGNVSAASAATTVVITPAGLNTTSEYRLTPQSATTYCLINPSATGTGTVLSGNTCTTNDARDWMFTTNDEGYTKIKLSGDRYLTVASATTTVVTTAALNATANITTQEWLVTASGTGFVIQSRIRPTYCLDRTGTTTVALALCSTTTDTTQIWTATAR